MLKITENQICLIQIKIQAKTFRTWALFFRLVFTKFVNVLRTFCEVKNSKFYSLDSLLLDCLLLFKVLKINVLKIKNCLYNVYIQSVFSFASKTHKNYTHLNNPNSSNKFFKNLLKEIF